MSSPCCYLLGFRFVPRLRDFQDYRLGAIEKVSAYKGIETLFSRQIRIDVVREHWDEIIRLAASIKAGVVAPSVILKKLAAFPRQNRLDFALSDRVGLSAHCSCSTGWRAPTGADDVMPA